MLFQGDIVIKKTDTKRLLDKLDISDPPPSTETSKGAGLLTCSSVVMLLSGSLGIRNPVALSQFDLVIILVMHHHGSLILRHHGGLG